MPEIAVPKSLVPTLQAHVYRTIYGPLIDTALYVRTALCHVAGPKKVSISRAQHPPTCPRNGFACIKSITYGAI
jgi:hypothetical protein